MFAYSRLLFIASEVYETSKEILAYLAYLVSIEILKAVGYDHKLVLKEKHSVEAGGARGIRTLERFNPLIA